jgi:ubiquinone/menaquinone biosynthesis C-methylase UbiE
MTLYDSIGKNYNATRQADDRIVAKLISLLDLPTGSTIADIGAGTGNYSNAIAEVGYQVIAIEPSQVMQSQQQPHPHVSWITASAEQIPLADNTVDGAVVMLTLHHFNELNAGLREINRITKSGKIVIFG